MLEHVRGGGSFRLIRAVGTGAIRGGLMAVSVTSGGCAWDTPQSTLVATSDFARTIHDVYRIIGWVTLGVALVVFLLLAWILFRFRDRQTAELPPQTRGHSALEIGWTIVPALLLLVIAVPTIRVIFRTQAAAAPPQALEVTVRGWQWWWEFRYPALGIVTANEMHIPAGRPIALRLEGPDVIHSFWIPKLGGKRDLIPGRVNLLSFTAEVPGVYLGQCAEFCGASHANMRKRVIVDTPQDFERWVAIQREPAAEPSGAAAEGKPLYSSRACVGCHTLRGVSAGLIGPDLTHFASRTTFGSGMFELNLDQLTAWIQDPSVLKPGVKMPALGLREDEARAIAIYLLSLK